MNAPTPDSINQKLAGNGTEKVAHVIGRLERGEAQIVFDPETETVSIVSTPGA